MAKTKKETKKEDNSFKALKRKKKVSCRYCNKIFNNRFDLIIHNASHITIPLIKLANLPSQNSKENIVKQDINNNKFDLNMNKINGAIKQESSTNRSDLVESLPEGHYANLMQPAEHMCEYCKSFFPNRFSLIKHQAVHMYVVCALKPQICRRCDRYIPGYPYNLQKHIKKVHRRSYNVRRRLMYLNYINNKKLNKEG